MREDGELDRVEFGSDLFPELMTDLDTDVSLASDRETTVRLNQDRAQLVHDDARSGWTLPCNKKNKIIKKIILYCFSDSKF